mgnify:CR=1 FL=1
MTRILIVECKQEVSTFNPVLSSYRDFVIRRGSEILNYHRQVRSEVGGALSVFESQSNLTVVPAYSAHFITSGGTLADTSFSQICNELLTNVAASLPVDGVYVSLHGAMATQTEGDPEGYLLRQLRRVLGEEVPIVISLDLHGILTDQMLEHCDAAVAFHTYPHVDFYETGQRAARVLLKILIEGARPITAKVCIPALVRGDELITATGSIRHAVKAAQEAENGPNGLSAAVMWGNPFTDVPALASNSFVATNNDRDLAAREALRIANLFWQHHDGMRVPLTSLNDAARQAAHAVTASPSGTVVLVDAADATSSGASGDSNAILHALIEVGYSGRALIPIVDAKAVDTAFDAGVGNPLNVPIGGSLDPQRFSPLTIQGRVRLLSDGAFHSETTRELWQAGRTAVIESGAFTLVVTSRAVSLYDRALFLAHGQDPRHYQAVVVKSPHCEPQMFKSWASLYLDVDAPGSTSANLLSLGHRRCARPMFPLDPDVTFTPEIKLFQRLRYRS